MPAVAWRVVARRVAQRFRSCTAMPVAFTLVTLGEVLMFLWLMLSASEWLYRPGQADAGGPQAASRPTVARCLSRLATGRIEAAARRLHSASALRGVDLPGPTA